MVKQRSNAAPNAFSESISRRKFLQSVIVASAATSAVSFQPSVGAAAGAVTAGDGLKVLTSEQHELLTAVLNHLIPEEGKMPGAGDLGVAGYVDSVLADAPHMRRPVFDVLMQTATSLAEDDREEDINGILAGIQSRAPESFEALTQVTYTGYYNHPRVLEAIGWVPPAEPDLRPAPFDTTPFEAVIQRGPIYRNV